MRKIFTTLKSVIAIAVIASMTLAASCSYDDSAINKRVDKVEKDLTALVERVEKLEESLQQQAPTLEELLGNKAVIVEVTTNEAGDTVIKLSNGKEITVLAPADSLQYRVVDGVLEVSADGQNWIVVNGVTGDQVVADVVISEDGKTATVILADGQEFVVGVAELIEFEGARDQVYVIAGASKEIAFAINDAVAEINIMNQPFGWSAEVEALDETRAVGGKNFVLKINGPAQELVAAGYAAKEGVVSVHFNTEAGACKVAKVNVNLAEITLDVDAKGNITLTNSVAVEYADPMGRAYFDFADFYIGIVPADVYAQYGDKSFTDNWDDMMWDYTANVASTQRTSGFGNKVDLQQYEEGVCEKESYTFTVDQLAQCFYPAYTLEYGKEYIIFATLDGEMVGYQVHPVLKSAVKETYNRVLVQASYVADSATWNNATFNFALAGFQYYLVGWVPTATVDEFIASGRVANVEEFVPFYIQGNSLMSSGALLSGNYSNQQIALADLATYSMVGWAPALSAGTEYVFYIYAFNAANEMELYQHTVVADNVFIFDNFTTAELVAGEFDAAAVAEVVEHSEKNITVNVAFSEDVVTVAYNWFNAPFADAEEAAAAILADEFYTTYVTFDEYTTYVEAYKYEYYGLPDPIYLAMLAINADGQYVYVEKEFKLPEPEPAPEVAVTSFEYLGRYYDIDDDASTSGGDFVYVVKGEDGTEYKIGLYWAYAEADGTIKPGTYNYCFNTFDVMYSGWDGFIIKSDLYYYGSSWVVAEDGTFVLKLVDANGNPIADYVYDGQGGEQPVEDSFTYLGRYYDIDDDDSTSGGDYVYKVVAGGVEYQLGLYWAYAETDGTIKAGVYNYCYNAFDVMYSGWDGFIIKSDSFYYGSTLTAKAEGVTLHLTDADGNLIGDYFFAGVPVSGDIEEPEEPEDPEQPAEPYVFTKALLEADYGFGDFYINFATEDEAVKVRLNFYNCSDDTKKYLPEMSYPVQTTYPAVYPDPQCVYSYVSINDTKYALDYGQGSVTVSEIEGKMYRFDIALVAGGGAVTVNGVYEGAIEGMIVPSDYVEPEQPEPGELQELTISQHSTIYIGAGEHELAFYYSDTHFVDIDFQANPITAGTYTLTDGLVAYYCQSHSAPMKECEAIVTENEDGTLTFDVTYMLNNDTLDRYHFTYTAAIYAAE
ncbi:MAG: hypothetical protein IKJ08_02575 [Alistipes sp.]|nr:hypothetical protein [Alistipes sp.]